MGNKVTREEILPDSYTIDVVEVPKKRVEAEVRKIEDEEEVRKIEDNILGCRGKNTKYSSTKQ